MMPGKFYWPNLANNIKILLLSIFLFSCSFSNSDFWTDAKKADIGPIKETLLFSEKEKISSELNTQLKILFRSPGKKYVYNKNNKNNLERYNFDFSFKNVAKSNLAKNKKFNFFQPDIDYHKKGFLLFNDKGSIINFDKNSNFLWKKNYYSKKEKKLSPYLFLGNNEKYILVADDLAKYYLLELNTGNKLWSKKNTSPFNSEIKFYKNSFFVVDAENTLKRISTKTGEQLWTVSTEKSIIRSKKRLSIVIIDDLVIFNNTLGDISAVNINNGSLIWQISTQGVDIYSNVHSLEMSDLIVSNNILYVANNRNDFYSIEPKSGIINWKQRVSTNLDPLLEENYIFLLTQDGYLSVIERLSGNLIRSSSLFKNIQTKKNQTILATGFTFSKNNFYVTTDNGKLLIVNIETGKIISALNFSKKKISNPQIIHKNLYIISDDFIIRTN